MTEKEALKELVYFQRWRRGANKKQPNPLTVGLAIDVAIKTLGDKITEEEKCTVGEK